MAKNEICTNQNNFAEKNRHLLQFSKKLLSGKLFETLEARQSTNFSESLPTTDWPLRGLVLVEDLLSFDDSIRDCSDDDQAAKKRIDRDSKQVNNNFFKKILNDHEKTILKLTKKERT